MDRQIQHGNKESLRGLGKWVARKWRLAQTKREEVNREVVKSERSPDLLRVQWSEQVAAQTKPLPREDLFVFTKVLIN